MPDAGGWSATVRPPGASRPTPRPTFGWTSASWARPTWAEPRCARLPRPASWSRPRRAASRLRPPPSVGSVRRRRSRSSDRTSLHGGSLAVAVEEAVEPLDGGLEIVDVRQRDDAEVVRARPVESRALDQEQVLVEQQVEHELLVVVDRVHGGVQAREDVEGAARLYAADSRDVAEQLT